MRHFRIKAGSVILPGLQLLTAVLTGLASTFEWTVWWLFAVPWVILNIAGVILAIPVIAVAFLVAGVAHLDWTSKSFFLGWFIGAPTILSLIAGTIIAAWRRKRARRSRPGFPAGPARFVTLARKDGRAFVRDPSLP